MSADERREIEVPEEFEQFMSGGKLEYRRRNLTGQADRIEIHIIQPDGAEQHRMSKFRVVDEDEGTVAFLRSNHDHPEPYQMALLGLNLSGWETTQNWEVDQTDTYRDEAQLLRTAAASHFTAAEDLDSFEQFVAEDLVARMYVMASLYEFSAEHDESLTERFERADAGDVLDTFGLKADSAVGEAAAERMLDYVKAWATDRAPEAIGGIRVSRDRDIVEDGEIKTNE